MRWKLVTIGKPKLAFAAAGIAEYLGRLRPLLQLEWTVLKAASAEKESGRFLTASEGCRRIALDERGHLLSSRKFAEKMAEWEYDGKPVALLIGGADGLPDAVKEVADWKWALGPQTMQHELATVVALEQLYRACQIRAGTPYHRE